MNDCIFCKIIDGVIPSQKVYEDEYVFAFRDIAPITPVHILVIPKIHIVSAADVTEENSIYVAKCFEAIAKIGMHEELRRGFRVITNSGKDGCQSVFHLHFHMLGGKPLPEGLI
jgi:histidine triad (HIT) family protein